MTNSNHLEERTRGKSKSAVVNAAVTNSSIRDAIVVMDEEKRISYWNSAAERFFGCKKEEAIGLMLSELTIPEKYREIMSKGLGASKETGQGSAIEKISELEIVRSDGSNITIEASVFPMKRSGKIEVLGIARDITDRKKLEEKLVSLSLNCGKLNTARTCREVYELALDSIVKTLGFEHASFAVLDKDEPKTVCYRERYEPASTPSLGTGKEGTTARTTFPHEPNPASNVRKDKDCVMILPQNKSGLTVPVMSEDKIIGFINVECREPDAFNDKDLMALQILAANVAIAINNITKRNETQRQIIQLTLLMEKSTQLVRSIDPHERLQSIVTAIRDTGWRRVVLSIRDETLEIINLEDIVVAGITEKEKRVFWKRSKSGKVWRERFGSEYERFKLGEFYYLPWSDPWVKEKFARASVRSKLTVEEMIDWNPQDLLYAPLKLSDGRIVGIISMDDPTEGKKPTKESLAPLELFLRIAAEAIEKARLLQQLKRYAEHLEEMAEEKTRKLRQAQKQLIMSERLASIGQVAAMIGHDLRNPLTGISGATYYLRTKLAKKTDKKIDEMLQLIEEDVQHSNKIINDLLDYSREIRLELNKTTPRAIIKKAIPMVEIPRNIKVSNSTKTRPTIKIDVDKMKRVFGNLIKNAVDAMPDGGRLSIKCMETINNIEFSFSDTGAGMSQDTLKKIWTPFFTTKAKGMGLGLPICKRIVEAHTGKISVKSTIGKGTVFKIIIPIEPKQQEEVKEFE